MIHLFDSFEQWKVCMLSGLRRFWWGLCRILTCLFFGFLSFLRWVWRLSVRAVAKYPNIALGGFIVLLVAVWLLTFVSMRTRAVGAEDALDSLSWEYSQFKEIHGYEKK